MQKLLDINVQQHGNSWEWTGMPRKTNGLQFMIGFPFISIRSFSCVNIKFMFMGWTNVNEKKYV